MSNDIKNLVQDVVASPLGDVIASVGEGVAEAQQALDDASLAKTLEIYSEGGDAALAMLREIGYRPTFYTLPETTGEVKVSLKLGGSSQSNTQQGGRKNRTGRPQLYASMVDAGYANRYAYQAEVSAKLSFKIVPVPPPEGVESLRLVPKLIGKTVAEAQAICQSLQLELEVVDDQGNVLESPDADAVINAQSPDVSQVVNIEEDGVTVTI